MTSCYFQSTSQMLGSDYIKYVLTYIASSLTLITNTLIISLIRTDELTLLVAMTFECYYPLHQGEL